LLTGLFLEIKLCIILGIVSIFISAIITILFLIQCQNKTPPKHSLEPLIIINPISNI
jgi:hypothetical protein